MITMRLKTRNTAPDDDDGETGLPVSRRGALSRHFAFAQGVAAGRVDVRATLTTILVS